MTKLTKNHVAIGLFAYMVLYIAGLVFFSQYIPGNVGVIFLHILNVLTIVMFSLSMYFGKQADGEELGFILVLVIGAIVGTIAIMISFSDAMEYHIAIGNYNKATEPATAIVRQVNTSEGSIEKLLVEYTDGEHTYRASLKVHGQAVYFEDDKISICYSKDDPSLVRSAVIQVADPVGWFCTDKHNPEVLNI